MSPKPYARGAREEKSIAGLAKTMMYPWFLPWVVVSAKLQVCSPSFTVQLRMPDFMFKKMFSVKSKGYCSSHRAHLSLIFSY